MVGVIAICLCVALSVAVLALARSLERSQRTLGALRATVAELRDDVAALAAPDSDDEQVEPAEPLPPYLSLARPVIKARALSAGTTSAARVLRQRLSNGKH